MEENNSKVNFDEPKQYKNDNNGMRKVIIAVFAILILVIGILISAVVSSSRPASRESASYTPRVHQSAKMSVDEYMDSLQQRLDNNDLDDADIEYDEDSNCIKVYLVVDGAEDVAEAAMSGYSEAEDAWSDFGDTCTEASGKIGADFQKNCGSDKHVAFILLDDEDTDMVLFTAIDGNVLYDAVTGEDNT